MIWVGGRIVPDDALSIRASDRTFEHGLGLFETSRTWSGHATLLELHLSRLRRSAGELGLPLDPSTLPDAGAVAALLRTNGVDGDAMLRITLTGGLSESHGSTLWMRSAPLPPISEGGISLTCGPWEVARGDLVTRHKALNYWSRRAAFESARRRFFDEILSHTADGNYWEGSRTNLFLVKEGELWTPFVHGPIVPGVMRGQVLEHARDLSMTIHETNGLRLEAILEADEVFLTNAVRGIIPVSRAAPEGSWPVPGRWTQRLWSRISDRLHRGRKNVW